MIILCASFICVLRVEQSRSSLGLESQGKIQHNPTPNKTNTFSKFQTYKNADKNINNQNHIFQTQAKRRIYRLPRFFPPN